MSHLDSHERVCVSGWGGRSVFSLAHLACICEASPSTSAPGFCCLCRVMGRVHSMSALAVWKSLLLHAASEARYVS